MCDEYVISQLKLLKLNSVNWGLMDSQTHSLYSSFVCFEVLPGLEVVVAEEHQGWVAVLTLAESEHSLITLAPLDAAWEFIIVHKLSIEAWWHTSLVATELVDSMFLKELVEFTLQGLSLFVPSLHCWVDWLNEILSKSIEESLSLIRISLSIVMKSLLLSISKCLASELAVALAEAFLVKLELVISIDTEAVHSTVLVALSIDLGKLSTLEPVIQHWDNFSSKVQNDFSSSSLVSIS